MERYAKIAKENVKLSFLLPFSVCAGLLALSPLFVGLKNLTEQDSAKVLEYYVIFLGIILITPIFLPEQSKAVRDLAASKYTPMAGIYTLRLFLALLGILLLTGFYMLVMKTGGCEFPFFRQYGGAVSGMLFLGGMGVLSYGLSNQVVIGYMIPVLYYILNIPAGYEKLGSFYLFSMTAGRYQGKACLAAGGIFMLAAGIFLRVRRE